MPTPRTPTSPLGPLVLLALLAPGMLACTTVHPTAGTPSAAVAAGASFSHQAFDRVLRRFVDERGRVDYAGLRRDRADLDSYLAALAAASPDSHPTLFPSDDDRLAYWINAYNAAVLAMVLAHHPIDSVKDVRSRSLFFVPGLGRFFLLQRIVLGGRRINLYDLERIVRKRFVDPSYHFALNCASRSCARLPRQAFDPARLQDQLLRATRAFVRDPRNVAIDPEAGAITLSAIFDWYEDDFVRFVEARRPGSEASLIGYLKPHLAPAQAEALRACDDCELGFFDYDWGLNDQRRGGGASAGLGPFIRPHMGPNALAGGSDRWPWGGSLPTHIGDTPRRRGRMSQVDLAFACAPS